MLAILPSSLLSRVFPGSEWPSLTPFTGRVGRAGNPRPCSRAVSREDGANLESRGARVTQIRDLDVATLARFGRSENYAWGWRNSGVPGSKSHADAGPRSRHVAAVLPLSILACNSHADTGPRSRHAAAVWPLSIPACNSHADTGHRSRHVAAVLAALIPGVQQSRRSGPSRSSIRTNSRSTASAALTGNG